MGCLVACLSMVTGHAYDDIRSRMNELGLYFDVGEGRGGMTIQDVEFYLGDHGFSYALKYRWLGANHPRPEWPTAPFAPAHICGMGGAGRHGVVLLPSGDVLDPMHDAPRSLADYDLAYMLGVWRIN